MPDDRNEIWEALQLLLREATGADRDPAVPAAPKLPMTEPPLTLTVEDSLALPPAVGPPASPAEARQQRNPHYMPRLAEDFEQRKAKVMARMAALGLPVKQVYGERMPEEQARLYAKGRTIPGDIVTAMDGFNKISRHQYANAADLAFLVNGQPSFAQSLPWKTLGDIAKAEGLTWGGDWTERDLVHIEGPAPFTSDAMPARLAEAITRAIAKQRR